MFVTTELVTGDPENDPENKNVERVVCNPTIKEYSEEIDVEEEGVCRAGAIMVEYQNELGQKTIRRPKGFEAREFQHEFDHIRGILHFDRFSPSDKEKNQSTLEKLIQKYDKADAVLEPDPAVIKKIQPPPLTAGRMPPMKQEETNTEKPKPNAKTKGGFGVGGFAGSGKNSKKKKKK